MSLGCDVVRDGKPLVWKDDDEWKASEQVHCRKCLSYWSNDLATTETWEDAMLAASPSPHADQRDEGAGQ